MAWDDTVTDVLFKIAKEVTRVILTINMPMAVGGDVVISLDSDKSGSFPEIITNMRQSVQKLRAVSTSDYSPLAYRELGLGKISTMPKLSIVGLDIEVTTSKRDNGSCSPTIP